MPSHPHQFSKQQRLSDWPGCRLDIRCRCGQSTLYPTKLLMERHGDLPFVAIVRNLRCKACGGVPAPVHLCAGFTRSHNWGGEPDWAVELVPRPDGCRD